ncbi:MAG TPA: hypothetical protein VLA16_09090, partial [Ideonella sp.]|nr:hypothetical protein [Ideonella sp.]
QRLGCLVGSTAAGVAELAVSKWLVDGMNCRDRELADKAAQRQWRVAAIGTIARQLSAARGVTFVTVTVACMCVGAQVEQRCVRSS